MKGITDEIQTKSAVWFITHQCWYLRFDEWTTYRKQDKEIG